MLNARQSKDRFAVKSDILLYFTGYLIFATYIARRDSLGHIELRDFSGRRRCSSQNLLKLACGLWSRMVKRSFLFSNGVFCLSLETAFPNPVVPVKAEDTVIDLNSHACRISESSFMALTTNMLHSLFSDIVIFFQKSFVCVRQFADSANKQLNICQHEFT